MICHRTEEQLFGPMAVKNSNDPKYVHIDADADADADADDAAVDADIDNDGDGYAEL